jgi:hypothetical protein
VSAVGDPTRVQVDTEWLYTATERAEARHLYAAEHPNGPAWDDADVASRGRYLETAGANWLARFGGRRG